MDLGPRGPRGPKGPLGAPKGPKGALGAPGPLGPWGPKNSLINLMWGYFSFVGPRALLALSVANSLFPRSVTVWSNMAMLGCQGRDNAH